MFESGKGAFEPKVANAVPPALDKLNRPCEFFVEFSMVTQFVQLSNCALLPIAMTVSSAFFFAQLADQRANTKLTVSWAETKRA